MKSRQTNAPAIAAAKAGLSTATAYRIEEDDAALVGFEDALRFAHAHSTPGVSKFIDP